jgi:hypothetical protein
MGAVYAAESGSWKELGTTSQYSIILVYTCDVEGNE